MDERKHWRTIESVPANTPVEIKIFADEGWYSGYWWSRIQVTDDLVKQAMDAYNNYKPFNEATHQECMRAALESIFNG